jgi:aldose sugar dehydrogenase
MHNKYKTGCAFSESYIPLSIISRRGLYNIEMKRKKPFVNHLVLLGLFAIVLEACTFNPQSAGMATQDERAFQQSPVVVETPITPEKTAEKTVEPATGWKVEIIAAGLNIPWSVVFPTADRMLISERSGTVREIVNTELNPDPIYIFEEVVSQEEAGLMGLALHPLYDQNRFVYACYAASGGEGIIDKVVRLVDQGDSLTFDRVIVDNIPSAQYHAGCRIKFGPDDMLYITTGDAIQKDLAQDIDSLAGKILRVDPDGNIPADNPFPGSKVYSLGHRNPQGIDWEPESGVMFSSEHGPSGFDGAPGGDEINLIVPGGNYGWPLVSHDGVLEGTLKPLIQFTPAEAPASALYYASDVMPFFTGSLFFGALRGEGVIQLVLSETNNQNLKVERVEKIISDVGRVRDVVAGPDGSIYFTTSNRDGRGQVRLGDDHLYRIFPVFN